MSSKVICRCRMFDRSLRALGPHETASAAAVTNNAQSRFATEFMCCRRSCHAPCSPWIYPRCAARLFSFCIGYLAGFSTVARVTRAPSFVHIEVIRPTHPAARRVKHFRFGRSASHLVHPVDVGNMAHPLIAGASQQAPSDLRASSQKTLYLKLSDERLTAFVPKPQF